MKIIIQIIIILILSGCNSISTTYNTKNQLTLSEAKVEFTGGEYDVSVLENKNDFPVVIRAVYRSLSHGAGEETVWVKRIEANDKIIIVAPGNFGFYIHKIGTGELIGFIRE